MSGLGRTRRLEESGTRPAPDVHVRGLRARTRCFPSAPRTRRLEVGDREGRGFGFVSLFSLRDRGRGTRQLRVPRAQGLAKFRAGECQHTQDTNERQTTKTHLSAAVAQRQPGLVQAREPAMLAPPDERGARLDPRHEGLGKLDELLVVRSILLEEQKSQRAGFLGRVAPSRILLRL